jgi:hypothetical protein
VFGGQNIFDPIDSPDIATNGRAVQANVITGGVLMAASRRYGEDIRSIGQALEARDIIDFELKRLADSYVIQGMPQTTLAQSLPYHSVTMRFDFAFLCLEDKK